MVDSKPDKNRTNPDFRVNHPDALKTDEYRKIAAIQLISEGLIATWDVNEVWQADFKRVVMDAVTALYTKPSPDALAKLGNLEDKLKKVTDAAAKPEDERTTQEQQLVEEEKKAADTTGDGVVTMSEGLKRVYDLFMEFGLEEQAKYFMTQRTKRPTN